MSFEPNNIPRPRPQRPWLTGTLLGVMGAVFLLELALQYLLGLEEVVVYLLLGAKYNALIAAGQYWRLITSVFLHGGLEHLLFNALALWVWGRYIEAMLGKWRYLTVFLAAGVAGALCSYVFSPYLSVGASGAIFGLFGALLYFRQVRRDLFDRFFGPRVILLIVINVAMGFLMPNIDIYGHLGGLLGGYLACGTVGLRGDKQWRAGKTVCLVLYVLLAAAAVVAGQILYTQM